MSITTNETVEYCILFDEWRDVDNEELVHMAKELYELKTGLTVKLTGVERADKPIKAEIVKQRR